MSRPSTHTVQAAASQEAHVKPVGIGVGAVRCGGNRLTSTADGADGAAQGQDTPTHVPHNKEQQQAAPVSLDPIMVCGMHSWAT